MTEREHVYSVTAFGGVGDGRTMNTAAFRRAVEAAAAAGGGTVFVPAGRYLTGPIRMRSRIRLELDAGAVIAGSDNPADFEAEGDHPLARRMSICIIGGVDLEDVAVTGRGTIDGQGAAWWQALREKKLGGRERPHLIGFYRCRDILLEGIALVNSPSWTVHPACCDNIVMHRLTVRNPYHSPNTDGLNPDACSNVRISDCHIDVGDDCITIKSGKESVPEAERRACEKITITNCTMVHGHGAVVIGSEMSGGVRDVVISNCVFADTERGIRIKTRRRRGGLVEDIRVSNIVMDRVFCPFVFNMYYKCGSSPDDAFLHDKAARPVDRTTPMLRNIHFSGISARRVIAMAGFLYGLPEMPIEGVTFSDVTVSMDESGDRPAAETAAMYGLEPARGAGFLAVNVKNVRFQNLEVLAGTGPALRLEKSRGVEVNGFRGRAPAAAPLIEIKNSSRITLSRCAGPDADGKLLRVSGAESADIRLADEPPGGWGGLIELGRQVPGNALSRP